MNTGRFWKGGETAFGGFAMAVWIGLLDGWMDEWVVTFCSGLGF